MYGVGVASYKPTRINKSSRPIVQTQGSTGDRVTEAFGKFDEATVTSEGVAKKTTEVRFLVRLLLYFPSRISTRMLSISSGEVFSIDL